MQHQNERREKVREKKKRGGKNGDKERKKDTGKRGGRGAGRREALKTEVSIKEGTSRDRSPHIVLSLNSQFTKPFVTELQDG